MHTKRYHQFLFASAFAVIAAGCSGVGVEEEDSVPVDGDPQEVICSAKHQDCPVICVKTGFGQCHVDDHTDDCTKDGGCEPEEPCEATGSCQVIDPCEKEGGCEPVDPCLKHGDCEPVDPCEKEGGCEPEDPCLKHGDCEPVDPCLKHGDCEPVDPCPKHLDECPPVDPCVKYPWKCEPEEPGCTLTQGYWRNHFGAWPINGLTIGGITYPNVVLLGFLWTPPAGGNASLILLHQYIAAVLNVAAGADSSAIDETAAAALAWFAANTAVLPGFVHASTPEGQEAVALAEILDAFNNGLIGPGHCDDEENGPIVIVAE